MKQVTAVEWIVEQLAPSVSLQQKYIDELLEQAKAMEKEQIMQSVNDGKLMALGTMEKKSLEKYYNETFNTK